MSDLYFISANLINSYDNEEQYDPVVYLTTVCFVWLGWMTEVVSADPPKHEGGMLQSPKQEPGIKENTLADEGTSIGHKNMP